MLTESDRRDPYIIAVGAAGLAMFLAFSVMIDWPAGSSARDDLRSIYGAERVTIRTLKTNTLDEACGYYSVARGARLWKFVENRQGLWAEQRSERWRSLGAGSPEEALWTDCIKHQRRGRGAYLYPMFDELTALILRLT
jgi:hypothetical protein